MQITAGHRRRVQQLLLDLHHGVRLVRGLRLVPYLSTSVLLWHLKCFTMEFRRCVGQGLLSKLTTSYRYGRIFMARFTTNTLIHLFYRSEQILTLTRRGAALLLTSFCPRTSSKHLINLRIDILLLDLGLGPPQWPMTTLRSRTTSW